MVPAMSNKEGEPPRPDVIGGAPLKHPKDARNRTDGADTRDAREARLAAALRDNLRRRKAAMRPAKDASKTEGS